MPTRGSCFGGLGGSLNWAEVRDAVSHSNPYLWLAAASILVSSYVVRAFSWEHCSVHWCRLGFGDLFAATTVGFGTVFLIGRAGGSGSTGRVADAR